MRSSCASCETWRAALTSITPCNSLQRSLFEQLASFELSFAKLIENAPGCEPKINQFHYSLPLNHIDTTALSHWCRLSALVHYVVGDLTFETITNENGSRHELTLLVRFAQKIRPLLAISRLFWMPFEEKSLFTILLDFAVQYVLLCLSHSIKLFNCPPIKRHLR